ncbi:hypothetical protein Tco_0488437 [Tanacetum coccineum]
MRSPIPLPPPPPRLVHQGLPIGSVSWTSCSGSSKTAATTTYTAWTTTTSRFEPSASSIPEDVFMHEESDSEAQDMVSDNEDIGCRHVPRIEECHKILTNQVDDRLLSKGDKLALSITKMKAAYYPDVGLEQMVPDQMSPEPPTAKGQEDSLYCCHHMDQESGYQTTSRRLLTRHRELPNSAEPSPKPRWVVLGFEFMHDYKILDSPRAVLFRDKYGMQMLMRFNEIHKFSDGTLQQIDEALDYRSLCLPFKAAKAQENLPELRSFVGGDYAAEDYRF